MSAPLSCRHRLRATHQHETDPVAELTDLIVDKRPVQRSLGGRGIARVHQGLRTGPRGDRLEARGQPISERKQPAVAEGEEPGVLTGVMAAKGISSRALGEFPFGRRPHRLRALRSSQKLSPGRLGGAVRARHRPARSAHGTGAMRAQDPSRNAVRADVGASP